MLTLFPIASKANGSHSSRHSVKHPTNASATTAKNANAWNLITATSIKSLIGPPSSPHKCSPQTLMNQNPPINGAISPDSGMISENSHPNGKPTSNPKPIRTLTNSLAKSIIPPQAHNMLRKFICLDIYSLIPSPVTTQVFSMPSQTMLVKRHASRKPISPIGRVLHRKSSLAR